MALAELPPAMEIKPNRVALNPGSDDRDPLGGDALGDNALTHEAV